MGRAGNGQATEGVGRMIATLNGETLEIVRHRRGTLWCPFCDHSTFDIEVVCKKCGAVFVKEPMVVGSTATGDDGKGTYTYCIEAAETMGSLTVVIPNEGQAVDKLACSVEGCGRLISTMPAAQANHRKKHEREAAA